MILLWKSSSFFVTLNDFCLEMRVEWFLSRAPDLILNDLWSAIFLIDGYDSIIHVILLSFRTRVLSIFKIGMSFAELRLVYVSNWSCIIFLIEVVPFFSLNSSSLKVATVFLAVRFSRFPLEVYGFEMLISFKFITMGDNSFMHVLPVSLLELKNCFKGRAEALGLSRAIRDMLREFLAGACYVYNDDSTTFNLDGISDKCYCLEIPISDSVDSFFWAAKSFTAYFNFSILLLLIFPGNLE